MSKTNKTAAADSSSEVKFYDFVSKSKLFAIISAVLVAASILVSFLGVDIAIEFKGGTMITYSFSGDIDSADVEKEIKEIVNSAVTVQQGDLFQSDDKKLSLSFTSSEGLTAEKQSAITDKLQEVFADNNLKILESTDVAASSGKNFFVKCIVAVSFSAIVLILYIAVRFKRISGWSSGLFAVIALLHDVVITYGSFVVIGFEINSNFIAVVLTILGCSINNTIVVYDRIRENRKLMPVAELKKLVNISTTQSISRSLRTSITTISTMIIISIVAYVSGVNSILSFSIPIIVGMTIGTYSSLCLAPTLWASWQSKHETKEAKKA